MEIILISKNGLSNDATLDQTPKNGHNRHFKAKKGAEEHDGTATPGPKLLHL